MAKTSHLSSIFMSEFRTIKRTAKEAPAHFKNHKLNCHATIEMEATRSQKMAKLENTTRISLLPNAIYISIMWCWWTEAKFLYLQPSILLLIRQKYFVHVHFQFNNTIFRYKSYKQKSHRIQLTKSENKKSHAQKPKTTNSITLSIPTHRVSFINLDGKCVNRNVFCW